MRDYRARLTILTGIALALAAADLHADRRELVLSDNWWFAKGELSSDVVQLEYDTADWTQVSVPHDWAIAGPFDPSVNGYAGKLPWQGVGWYRRDIELSDELRGSQVYLDFDGVMAFPKVYVNGHLAGQWDYGYMSFRVDATPYVKFGQKNVVVVKADTRQHGTRWYPGAGIYRKVKLTICEAVHFRHWGLRLTTPKITDSRADVRVQATIENHSNENAELSLDIAVRDPKGQLVAEATSSDLQVTAGSAGHVDHQVIVTDPERWDVISPQLYTVIVTATRDNLPVDAVTSSFGVPDVQLHSGRRFSYERTSCPAVWRELASRSWAVGCCLLSSSDRCVNWRSCGTWGVTPSAPAIIRRPRNSSISVIAWGLLSGTSVLTNGIRQRTESVASRRWRNMRRDS